MNRRVWVVFLFVFLLLVTTGLVFFSVKLTESNFALRDKIKKLEFDKNERAHVVQQSFLDGVGSGVFSDERLYFNTKERLIASKEKFVDVDLSKMELRLYTDGVAGASYAIRTKGREGSWWETPVGEYAVISKSANHFSSIGGVWMPWSIQFYGNFFIHGWPYYPDGREVEQRYSGGCIRLGTEDAKNVYEFVSRGTPILIYEESASSSLPSISPTQSSSIPPALSGEGAFAADIDSGEILFAKNEESSFPIASVTKLMTAVVASELVYLERGVTITSSMKRDAIQSYPLTTGQNYKAFDLFYPLLMESSNGSARALASFVGEGEFVRQLNEKAKTLRMNQTSFVDPAGIGDGNVSSLKDLARLAKYISDKRLFVFDITRGKNTVPIEDKNISKIKNFNEFSADPRLLGMKNGETQNAKQSIFSVWTLKDAQGNSHRIFIGVLKSEDRKHDVELSLQWLQDHFGLQ